MADEQVRIWRPDEESRVLLMAGRTTGYAIEPRGEYVFGVLAGAAMRSRRGHERRLVRPGQLVAWDPSNGHAGVAVEGRAWSARLLVVEIAALAAITADQESSPLTGVAFPRPVVSDPALAGGFLRMHAALAAPDTRLERDELLAEWLRAAVERLSTRSEPRPPLTPREDRAFRLACDYLGEQPQRNIGLDELADAAEIGKFRLIRIFRARTGLPPHALQIAHRIHAARRLLEAGESIASTAAATGFADQSHLHRHFRRSLGMTPGEYRGRFQPR